ncbi:glycosyltransferase family 4 protein [Vibrio maerlii]|uniref:glycosyltransferase family 4 protein n=1 Tax=Vibrio maerlii TaxID=2231648 RepID=UPI000E3CE060|nr:glycosyltransferase family 4 protein [Vibrio maerlii]
MSVATQKQDFIIYAPDIHQGDAVGNHCLGVYRLAERLGFQPKIAALRSTFDGAVYRTTPVESVLNSTNDKHIIFVSYSIYDENIERLSSQNCRKICYFHNVTTPSLLEEFDPITADLCRKSFDQFSFLAQFDLLFCNSTFSKESLGDVGKHALVIPPIFPDQLATFSEKTNTNEGPRDTLTYIGRLVPHKNLEDLITIISEAKKKFGKALKLNIIGNDCNLRYSNYLKELASDLDVAKQCIFHGAISTDMMISILSTSDVYITASEHEGFCIPVLEASLMGIPSVVKGGSATEELLNCKELVFHEPEDATNKVINLLEDEEMYSKFCNQSQITVDKVFSLISDESWKKAIETVA